MLDPEIAIALECCLINVESPESTENILLCSLTFFVAPAVENKNGQAQFTRLKPITTEFECIENL